MPTGKVGQRTLCVGCCAVGLCSLCAYCHHLVKQSAVAGTPGDDSLAGGAVDRHSNVSGNTRNWGKHAGVGDEIVRGHLNSETGCLSLEQNTFNKVHLVAQVIHVIHTIYFLMEITDLL